LVAGRSSGERWAPNAITLGRRPARAPALASFLREGGVDVLFKSARDGHHWHNWRDPLRDGLVRVLRSGSKDEDG
ncbi:MAG TPA: hypothetical protein PKA33_21455, partial [Amaricoccus sp.]|uniref:hypothetical protein n=1 Tax=Amaricoccus sp. TaxID=1872485 RepID=UPI002C56DB0A